MEDGDGSNWVIVASSPKLSEDASRAESSFICILIAGWWWAIAGFYEVFAVDGCAGFQKHNQMGWFRSQKDRGDSLIESLFEAVDRQDWGALETLCRRHQDEIRGAFPVWRKVPEPIRADPAATDRYCCGLMTVAQMFEHLGDRGLLELLIGDNPLVACKLEMDKAQGLMDQDRHDDAIELLRATATRAGALEGDESVRIGSRVYAMLGVACFRVGRKAEAIEFVEKAKRACAELGDEKGVSAYAGLLRQMAESAGPSPGAGVDDGSLHQEQVGGAKVPSEAEELHNRAREAGARGNYREAIALFEEAAEVAPEWPYPIYDSAYTYLLMEDADSAARFYAKTVELSPTGFFTAITALDALERETKGDIPRGTYLAYVSLERMADPVEKAQKVRQMLKRASNFAPLWKELLALAQGDGERAEAIEKGLAANPDRETHGQLMISRALLLRSQNAQEEARELLRKLASDPESTLSTKALARAVLASFGT